MVAFPQDFLCDERNLDGSVINDCTILEEFKSNTTIVSDLHIIYALFKSRQLNDYLFISKALNRAFYAIDRYRCHITQFTTRNCDQTFRLSHEITLSNKRIAIDGYPTTTIGLPRFVNKRQTELAVCHISGQRILNAATSGCCNINLTTVNLDFLNIEQIRTSHGNSISRSLKT